MAARTIDPDGGDDYAPLAEINVTPMVDVMLVLLIIFMVAAPLMMVGVPVELPRTAAAKVGQTRKPLIVSIDREGHIFVREEAHDDDCRWRAKDWHPSALMDVESHRNYHLGFRCCAGVE